MALWRIASIAALAGLLGFWLPSGRGSAAPDDALPLPAALCLEAAATAAAETGVPLQVLLAVSLTETGRAIGGRLLPWPWTLNIEGDGFWFDTHAEALARARASRAAGRVSFDTGCFQVNYRWHGEAFASLEDMLDPVANAVYAGRFLARLRAETGSWSAAAGAYHSRTPRHATRYRAIFDRHYAALDQAPLPLVAARARPAAQDERRVARLNAFPLLQPGDPGPRSPGSLVPLRAGNGGLFARARPLWGN